MKKFQIFSLAIFAVLAFASSAYAAESAQLLAAGATIPLSTEVHVEVLAEGNTLTLTDMKEGIGVLCTPEGLGFALSNGAGTQETGFCSNASTVEGTCGSPKVTAVNLPWTLQVEQEGTVFTASLKSSVTAGPGWEVECTVLGVKVTDKCTTQAGRVTLENESSGLVMVTFVDANESEWALCSLGGEKAGLVAGLFYLHALGTEAEELETLAVSLATTVE